MALTRYDVTYEDADGNTQVASTSTENENGDWVKASDAEALQTQIDQQADMSENIEELKEAFSVRPGQPFNKMLAKVSERQAQALKAIFDES